MGSSNRRRRVGIIVTAGAVAAVLIVTLVLFLPSSSSGSCAPSPPSYLTDPASQQLLACHTSASLPANSYVSYSMPRDSDTETVVGQYTATFGGNASVEAFLINGSQLSQLETNPHLTEPPAGVPSTCGAVNVCDVSVAVPPSPDQYYLTLENLGGSPASVEWTQSLILYYVSR